MGNLSTLGSLFTQPNGLGMIPLNTTEVAQTYVDLLRPYVDFVIILSHLGLNVDQDMVQTTTGIDIVLGGHNHIVINPPQQLQDCTADQEHPGYVWAVDPNIPYNPNVPPPAVDNTDPSHPIPLPDPTNHPYEFQRPCVPRNVIIEHSGAFSKYVGRDDLVLSNDPKAASIRTTGSRSSPTNTKCSPSTRRSPRTRRWCSCCSLTNSRSRKRRTSIFSWGSRQAR
jgi:5'-nucleotidase